MQPLVIYLATVQSGTVPQREDRPLHEVYDWQSSAVCDWIVFYSPHPLHPVTEKTTMSADVRVVQLCLTSFLC